MKNVPVQFNMAECSTRAEAIFLTESGLAGDGEMYERMRRAAFAVREELAAGEEPGVRLRVKGLYSICESFLLEGRRLTVADVNLECAAFEQIDPETIEGVLVYVLTAGDFHLEERSITDQLYADLWGTAFVDAAREMLVDEIRRRCSGACDSNPESCRISDSFGPGFYGMDLAEIHKMPQLVDFGKLGVEINESGIIVPVKSCAGIFFKVNEKYRPIDAECRQCPGNRKSCRLCRVYQSGASKD